MFFIQLCNAQDSIRVNTNADGNQEYILSEDKSILIPPTLSGDSANSKGPFEWLCQA